MTNEEIARFFNNARPHIQAEPNPRDPHVEGWFRTRQHFQNSTDQTILLAENLLESTGRANECVRPL